MVKKRRKLDKHATPTLAYVVSYVPLLVPKSDPIVTDISEASVRALLEGVDDCPSGHVQGCVWLSNGKHVQPVFVMDNARLIADHLLMWCENCPGDWFSLCFTQRDDRYGIVLFPNIQKSIQRFQENWMLRFREKISPEKCHVIFRHLYFVSGSRHMFDGVRERLPETTHIGFVDSADLDLERIVELDPGCVKTVGPVKVCWDSKPFGVGITGIIDDLFDPASEDSAKED